MKLKKLTIEGFRGFNDLREIFFNEKLTLIYAPNSYGKTSISEAMEWLLYGITSKVRKAESKEEFKNSYRNSHYPLEKNPFVEASLSGTSGEIILKGSLVSESGQLKLFNGNSCESWPFNESMVSAPEPFILQHALKNLLLASPSERFQGFASLLGLDELETIRASVASLCTKPQVKIPIEIQRFLQGLDQLTEKLSVHPRLSAIGKSLSKGKLKINETFGLVKKECFARAPDAKEENLLSALIKQREEAQQRHFKGQLKLSPLNEQEREQSNQDVAFFLRFSTDTFLTNYIEIIKTKAIDEITDSATFFNLGMKIVQKRQQCPMCGQALNENVMAHIHAEHSRATEEAAKIEAVTKKRETTLKALTTFKEKLGSYHQRINSKIADVSQVGDKLSELERIFSGKHDAHLNPIRLALESLGPDFIEFINAKELIESNCEEVIDSINKAAENIDTVKIFSKNIIEYLSKADAICRFCETNSALFNECDSILKKELDAIAGTEDLGLLIELFDKKEDYRKKYDLEEIVDGLKDLKKIVEQYVSEKMLSLISNEFTTEVMDWYHHIKTDSDPNVHFSGFEMGRNSRGELRSRVIEIKASSYGKDLASAVSTLSESKLNALGLCLSIASNLKKSSPFSFLVIDDPIQSWDEDHATKFISVIKKLIEAGKQIVLLTHSRQWAGQVRSECRSINGFYYEFTGYNLSGPHFKPSPWESINQRLQEIDAICKDISADPVRLQQAEEEVRIVICEITSSIYKKRKGLDKNPHDMNSTVVRKCLVECGLEVGLIDRVCSTFSTTDDAHHAPQKYSPNRERIKTFHAWLHELKQHA